MEFALAARPDAARQRERAAARVICTAHRRRPLRQILRKWRLVKRFADNMRETSVLHPTHVSLLFVMALPTPPDAHWLERYRDRLFRVLTRPFFEFWADVWGVLSLISMIELRVVSSILGPYDRVADASYRAMMLIFFYNFTVSLPWRIANLHHLSCCTAHSCRPGVDYYGRPTTALWFFIPPARRRTIVLLNLLCTVGGLALTTLVFGTHRADKADPDSPYQQWNLVLNVVWMSTWAASLLLQHNAESKLRRDDNVPLAASTPRCRCADLCAWARAKAAVASAAASAPDDGDEPQTSAGRLNRPESPLMKVLV